MQMGFPEWKRKAGRHLFCCFVGNCRQKPDDDVFVNGGLFQHAFKKGEKYFFTSNVTVSESFGFALKIAFVVKKSNKIFFLSEKNVILEIKSG